MVKKYKSLSHLLRIVVRVNNKITDIEFSKANLGHGLIGSAYVTDNADIQKALENHEYFGRKIAPAFWTDDIEKEVAKENVPVQEEQVEKEIEKGRKPKTK